MRKSSANSPTTHAPNIAINLPHTWLLRDKRTKFLYSFICRYERLLRRARTEDLSEVSGIGCLYQSGYDRLGRPVVVFCGKWFPAQEIDLEKVKHVNLLWKSFEMFKKLLKAFLEKLWQKTFSESLLPRQNTLLILISEILFRLCYMWYNCLILWWKAITWSHISTH